MQPIKEVFENQQCDRVITYTLPDGEYHREDGPAYVYEYGDGRFYEEWRCIDLFHRYGGPARMLYPDMEKDYFVHGKDVTTVVEEWLSEHGYVWETMSDIEKWELDMFMRSLG